MQLRTFEPQADMRSMVSQSYLVMEELRHCKYQQASHTSGFDITGFIEWKQLFLQRGYQWFRSRGFEWYLVNACYDGSYHPEYIVKLNVWLIVGLIAFASLYARFLSGSWTMSMIVALMLFSRGSLVGRADQVTGVNLISLLLVLWVMGHAHFFKSGSMLSLTFLVLVQLCLVMVDPVFIFIGLALPTMMILGYAFKRVLARPMVRRFSLEKKRLQDLGPKIYSGNVVSGIMVDILSKLLGVPTEQQSEVEQIGAATRHTRNPLFGVLREPFALWVFQKKRWLRIGGILGSGTVILLVSVLAVRAEYIRDLELQSSWATLSWPVWLDWGRIWGIAFLSPFDLHLSISFAIVLVCCALTPAVGLGSLFENCWLLILSMFFVTISTFVFDGRDLLVLNRLAPNTVGWSSMAWMRASHIITWFEPIILAAAVIGVYHLLLVTRRIKRD